MLFNKNSLHRNLLGYLPGVLQEMLLPELEETKRISI